MTGIPRQGVAIAVAAASLGLALIPARAPALPGLPTPPLPTLPSIPTLPATLPTDPAALASALAALGIDTPEELAAAIAAATPAQLSALIQGLDPATLQAALAKLTPAQLATVTATVVALAAQAGAPPEVIALAQTLTGTTPTGGGSGGGGGTGATPGGGGGTPTGGGTTIGGGSTPTVNRAIRATITKLKLTRNRRRIVVTLSCPAAAPACGVGIVGMSRGKQATNAKLVTIAKGKSLSKTLKLKRKAAKRLRRTGGKLLVAADTVGSSLPPATKTVRAKKPKH